MTDLMEFEFNSMSVRMMEREGEPWFVARDIAEVLEYRSASDALRILDDDEKLLRTLCVSGQNREVNLINESGLYSLVLRSNKPEAKVFKKWVTSEVLPSIRKHGGYLTAEKTAELIANPDLIIELAQNVKNEREKRIQAEKLAERNEQIIKRQDEVILQVKPKVEYYQKVLDSDDGILTNVIAKELGMSAVTLNRILKDKKVIYKQGGTWVLYQRYQGKGFTKTKTYTYTDSDGETHSNIQTVWTQKGREFIHSILQ